MIGSPFPKDYKKEMLNYLPVYYHSSSVVNQLLDTEAKEMEDIQFDIEDVLNQFHVEKATWGLDTWEKMCGIIPDKKKPANQRRSQVISRLSGVGTVTLDMIENMANSFHQTLVTENTGNYQVIFTLTELQGRPDNLDDMIEAIEQIIPAHLAMEFVFTYLFLEEFKNTLLTDTSRTTSIVDTTSEVLKVGNTPTYVYTIS